MVVALRRSKTKRLFALKLGRGFWGRHADAVRVS
jgi:hypothetical protein